MDNLNCVVERITFKNPETGYCVVKCKSTGYKDLVTAVGVLPDLHIGSVLNLSGEWKFNPKYGQQFAVQSCEESLPATAYGIEKYLGSGLVKGIGPAYAKRIVAVYGEDTLNVIDADPDALLRVPGIGKRRADRIRASWAEQKEIRSIMVFLQGHDISIAQATKIYKQYGNNSIRVVQDNPYRLADDIWGIGFKVADSIAMKLGFDKEKYVRIRSGILYTLNQMADDGHCFAMMEDLVKASGEILDVQEDLLLSAIDNMIRSQDVVADAVPVGIYGEVPKCAIYLPMYYRAETGVARRISDIAHAKAGLRVNPDGLARRIGQKTGMHYDDVQMQAILQAVSSKMLVLTGGPGTGKTTTTLGIITAFRESGARILLAAPTGRAAKRLAEATGMDAKTIHRLIGTRAGGGYSQNEENPLRGDVLIVDECSMIDILLMHSLLRAVPDSMTVILVGDTDQLPSVGAGNVLRDIIASACIPVIRLTRIFRQAQTSRIVMNAHRINAGQMPDISNGNQSDFFFMEREEPEEIAGVITDLVQKKLPDYCHVDPKNIQVLTPMQKGPVGAVALNQMLQERLNPDGCGLKRGATVYRTGDKVMQIRNNYDKEVFNGDIGIVSSVNMEDRELTVMYDEREVSYEESELDELVLAYATTIHKSQGSEYPVVVMPVTTSHYIMLQRNLIYTGITRAKKILVMVGTKKALGIAVKNVTVTKRNTMLGRRIRERAW